MGETKDMKFSKNLDKLRVEVISTQTLFRSPGSTTGRITPDGFM